jgi:hypothetical protein
VASLISWTWAAATVAPLESETVPRMRPPVLCAVANGAKTVSAITAAAKHVRREIRSAAHECAGNRKSGAFMNPPPAAENFFFKSLLRGCLRAPNLTIIPQS